MTHVILIVMKLDILFKQNVKSLTKCLPLVWSTLWAFLTGFFSPLKAYCHLEVSPQIMPPVRNMKTSNTVITTNHFCGIFYVYK